LSKSKRRSSDIYNIDQWVYILKTSCSIFPEFFGYDGKASEWTQLRRAEEMKAEWFAGRLRELREAAGLTQEQLAERAGMAWRTITHLEGGDRKPTWETVLALCLALRVDCGEFAKEPTTQHEPRRGRPPKTVPEQSVPKKPRGRPRKGG
jgi:DNA-binding XRE family transcriptional regulator